MSGFTHFNEDGNAVMVDVGAKAETKREALASGGIRMSEECFQKVKIGSMNCRDHGCKKDSRTDSAVPSVKPYQSRD